jgi:hypothetical protein
MSPILGLLIPICGQDSLEIKHPFIHALFSFVSCIKLRGGRALAKCRMSLAHDKLSSVDVG